MEKDLEKIVATNNKMIEEGYKKYQIARELGFSGESNCNASSALNKKLKKAEKKGFDVVWSKSTVVRENQSAGKSVRDKNMSKLTFSHIPDKNPPVDVLWEKRIDEFERVKAHADGEAKVTIDVDENKPIGLLLMGDPHIDNPGCNVPKLLSDVNLAETTEAMYAVNIGDSTDGWIGYLAKLYAKHETTKDQSYILLEDLISRVPWLFCVSGNHDKWGSEYLDSFAKRNKLLSIEDEVNVKLKFKNDFEFSIHARHNYPGKSQWSGALGQVKFAKVRGVFDLLVGGHTHSCAYEEVVIKDVHSGEYRLSHCQQLGSYKQKSDDYAKAGGFEDTNITPSVVFIIDPTTSDPTKKCLRFSNVEAGVEYLTYLRSR